ncbi:MAG: glutamate transport system substrate-binding protein [Actinomycetota bacterium]|jgi:glutamate transport system substrate-binding protein|nr:glutamate transport system substrate-binding protein [Actinomycetota bacterium]
MRAVRWPVAVLVATLSLAAGCSSGKSTKTDVNAKAPKFEAGTTMAALNTAQKITIGTKFDQPLFGLKGLSGQPEGFDVEIAKIIVGDLGIPESKIAWVETPSAVREEKIAQGAVDLVSATYTINPTRKERVSFAGPYYVAGQDLMVKKDNTTVTGPESLKAAKAKVCSVAGSTPGEKIKAYVDPAQLVLFDVYSKCGDALRTGQVDVVTTDNVILLGLIDKSGGAFKLVGKPFTSEPYGIGIKKGDVKFCQFIDSVLQKAVSDGRYQAAWDKTAGKVAGGAPALPPADPCV